MAVLAKNARMMAQRLVALMTCHQWQGGPSLLRGMPYGPGTSLRCRTAGTEVLT